MIYRKFGRTEIDMPVFSCGSMRYQHSWKDKTFKDVPVDNQDNLRKTMHRAFELGINHFETARGYGTSEIQMGKVLPEFPREKIYVQTKINPEYGIERFREDFEKSFKNLQMDYIDLLAIHGINDEKTFDLTMKKGGALDALREYQKEGRIKHIGFATHGYCDIICKAIDTGEFDFVNLHWYFIYQLNQRAIDLAKKHNMGVFIISPNDKGGKLYAPPEKLVNLCKPLSPMAFNNIFCLSQPYIHTLSVGAARPEDFDEHINSINNYDDNCKLIGDIVQRIEDEMDNVLAKGWSQNWYKNIPEYFNMPDQVNVLEIIRLWGLARGLDMVDFADRYNLMGSAGNWFPGTNGATFDEKAIVEATKDNIFSERIPEMLRDAHSLLYKKPAKRLSQSSD